MAAHPCSHAAHHALPRIRHTVRPWSWSAFKHCLSGGLSTDHVCLSIGHMSSCMMCLSVCISISPSCSLLFGDDDGYTWESRMMQYSHYWVKRDTQIHHSLITSSCWLQIWLELWLPFSSDTFLSCEHGLLLLTPTHPKAVAMLSTALPIWNRRNWRVMQWIQIIILVSFITFALAFFIQPSPIVFLRITSHCHP